MTNNTDNKDLETIWEGMYNGSIVTNAFGPFKISDGSSVKRGDFVFFKTPELADMYGVLNSDLKVIGELTGDQNHLKLGGQKGNQFSGASRGYVEIDVPKDVLVSKKPIRVNWGRPETGKTTYR